MSVIPEGTQIGVYRVSRLLGMGGMGAVYEAIHSEINRKVAIKVLHAHFAEKPEFKVRFTNEAKLANVVDHPGLVQIADYGQLSDGAAYLVMEYLKGETLSERIKRSGGMLSQSDAIRFAYLVADSLEAAHSKGVIHRDLKPDNVMIVPDRNVPGGERTKLLDFGIAKLADDTDSAHIPTQTGMMMGTPSYMSPEQCRGLRDLDARTDVYAFGAMLYVMLSGKPPFTGSLMEVVSKHIFEPPPALETLAPGVSPRIAALSLRMLSKDKASRPTMSEVASELEDMLEHRPLLKRTPLPEQGITDSATVPLPAQGALTLPQKVLPKQVRPATLAPSWRRLGVPVGAGVLVSIGLLAIVLSKLQASDLNHRTSTESGMNTKPRFVRWIIDSEPRGAKIIRESDGRQLCTTLCNREQQFGADVIEVQVHLDGYADTVLQLATNSDERRLVTLNKMDSGAPEIRPDPGKNRPIAGKKLRQSLGSAASTTGKSVTRAMPQPEK